MSDDVSPELMEAMRARSQKLDDEHAEQVAKQAALQNAERARKQFLSKWDQLKPAMRGAAERLLLAMKSQELTLTEPHTASVAKGALSAQSWWFQEKGRRTVVFIQTILSDEGMLSIGSDPTFFSEPIMSLGNDAETVIYRQYERLAARHLAADAAAKD